MRELISILKTAEAGIDSSQISPKNPRMRGKRHHHHHTTTTTTTSREDCDWTITQFTASEINV